MDSSQVLGNSEECEGNESSWTMYIGSLTQSSNYEDDHVGASTFIQGQGYSNHAKEDGGDDESDDSMASDASSGPNRQKKKLGAGYFGAVDHNKQQTKGFSGKKTQRQMKQRDGRNLETTHELVLKANSAASHVQSVNKVRKSK